MFREWQSHYFSTRNGRKSRSMSLIILPSILPKAPIILCRRDYNRKGRLVQNSAPCPCCQVFMCCQILTLYWSEFLSAGEPIVATFSPWYRRKDVAKCWRNGNKATRRQECILMWIFWIKSGQNLIFWSTLFSVHQGTVIIKTCSSQVVRV